MRQECALMQAAVIAPTSPEPLQAEASLLYEQDKAEEALALLKRSIAMWRPVMEDDEDSDADMVATALAAAPSHNSQVGPSGGREELDGDAGKDINRVRAR
jgi:hypothetical protein